VGLNGKWDSQKKIAELPEHVRRRDVEKFAHKASSSSAGVHGMLLVPKCLLLEKKYHA
jgi:hypothetical protein